jgi:hypothetical protein
MKDLGNGQIAERRHYNPECVRLIPSPAINIKAPKTGLFFISVHAIFYKKKNTWGKIILCFRSAAFRFFVLFFARPRYKISDQFV